MCRGEWLKLGPCLDFFSYCVVDQCARCSPRVGQRPGSGPRRALFERLRFSFEAALLAKQHEALSARDHLRIHAAAALDPGAKFTDAGVRRGEATVHHGPHAAEHRRVRQVPWLAELGGRPVELRDLSIRSRNVAPPGQTEDSPAPDEEKELRFTGFTGEALHL